MTKKSMSKLALILCLVLAFVVSLTACSNNSTANENYEKAAAAAAGEGGEEELATTSYVGGAYVYNGLEYTLKKEDLPANYKLVPYDKFVEGFTAIVNDYGRNKGELTYDKLKEIMGDDGIELTARRKGQALYFAWYSDKDDTEANDGSTVHVLVTFMTSEEDGQEVIRYYSYTGMGISKDDVK